MDIENGFLEYARMEPDDRKTAKRLSLCIRRAGILTMEELQAVYNDNPEKIECIRGVGPKSEGVIDRALRAFNSGENTNNL